jgi:hypothetical protein
MICFVKGFVRGAGVRSTMPSFRLAWRRKLPSDDRPTGAARVSTADPGPGRRPSGIQASAVTLPLARPTSGPRPDSCTARSSSRARPSIWRPGRAEATPPRAARASRAYSARSAAPARSARTAADSRGRRGAEPARDIMAVDDRSVHDAELALLQHTNRSRMGWAFAAMELSRTRRPPAPGNRPRVSAVSAAPRLLQRKRRGAGPRTERGSRAGGNGGRRPVGPATTLV